MPKLPTPAPDRDKPQASPPPPPKRKEYLALPEWLTARTFTVAYSPNCNKKFCVRLVRPGTGSLDMLRVGTKDQVGYGNTLIEAADNARQE